jgi:hypothetical protein
MPSERPVYPGCQSAGPHGIGKYDCSCEITVRGGAQCRTMLSQRPCGSGMCTRPECCSGSVSVLQPVEAPEVLKTLVGLSDKDLQTLAQALTALRKASPVGMDYKHVDTLRGKIVDLWLMS